MLLRSDVVSALAVTVGIGLAVQTGATADATRDSAELRSDAEPVSFAQEVMPILEARCVECHSEENAELGLKLDTYEGLMAGSDYGSIVEAGDPDGSLMIDMIQSGDMPEEGDPVPAEELEVLRTWIAEGAEKN
jgi:uncharacterized membrane protein